MVRLGLGGSTGGPGGFGWPTRRYGRDQEALLEVREGSGVSPGGLGRVGRPTRKFGRDWEAHQEVREESVGIGRPIRMFGRVCEANLEVRQGSGGSPGSPGGGVRPTWRPGKGQVAHQGFREGSGGPPGGPGEVGKPTQRPWKGSGGIRRSTRRFGRVGRHNRRSGMGWEANLEVWEGSRGKAGGQGEVVRSTQRSRRGCERSGGPPRVSRGIRKQTGGLGGSEAHSDV